MSVLFFVSLAIILSVAACGGAGGSKSNNNGGGGGGGSGGSQPAKFAYVFNTAANPVKGLGASITGFDVNGSTGALSPLTGSPFAAQTGLGLAATPDGKFLYAGTDINLQTSTCSVVRFGINADGTLTNMGITTAPVLHILSNLRMHPSGHFLYFVADTPSGPGTFGFQIGTDGSLTPIAGMPVVQSGWSIQDVTISSSGSLLYATAFSANSDGVWAYSIDQSTGRLTPVAGAPFSVHVGPPNPAGNAPNKLFATADTQGRFLFVLNNIDDDVVVMGINSTTGTLTQVGSPLPTPNFAPGFADVDPAGKFLFVASTFGGNLIEVFSIDNSGALTAVPGSPFNNGPITFTLKVDPTGAFLYVVNIDPGKVMVYSIGANGAITQISGSPFVRPEMNGTNPAFIVLVQ